MDTDKKTVKVSIYGMEYPVKAGDDIEYIKSVAEYVDALMNKIDKTISKKSPLRVAVMAALNIADELFKERNENKKFWDMINRDESRLIEKINEKIQGLDS